MRIVVSMTVLATALACSLASVPAHARARVFVASYGNDSNPCTFLSPCKTFQQAVNVVDAGGEVTAIDSAGFGPVTITNKSVTISSPAGVEAGIVPTAGGAAIDITAASPQTITLRGLTLTGGGIAAKGIYLSSTAGGALNVIDCVVKDFTDSGIAIQPSSGTTTVAISNTYSLNNGADGIRIAPTNTADVRASIAQSTANNNANGINIDTSASVNTYTLATIDGSHIDFNGNGIVMNGAAGAAPPNNNASLFLIHSSVHSDSTGLIATNADAAFGDTFFECIPTDINVGTGADVTSFITNNYFTVIGHVNTSALR
jgi:hypothetical protein